MLSAPILVVLAVSASSMAIPVASSSRLVAREPSFAASLDEMAAVYSRRDFDDLYIRTQDLNLDERDWIEEPTISRRQEKKGGDNASPPVVTGVGDDAAAMGMALLLKGRSWDELGAREFVYEGLESLDERDWIEEPTISRRQEKKGGDNASPPVVTGVGNDAAAMGMALLLKSRSWDELDAREFAYEGLESLDERDWIEEPTISRRQEKKADKPPSPPAVTGLGDDAAALGMAIMLKSRSWDEFGAREFVYDELDELD